MFAGLESVQCVVVFFVTDGHRLEESRRILDKLAILRYVFNSTDQGTCALLKQMDFNSYRNIMLDVCVYR